MFNAKELIDRVMTIIKIVPAVKELYVDLKTDGQLSETENLTKISAFIAEHSTQYANYASHNEVCMFICGLLGLLHAGDSSDVYLKLLNHEADVIV